MAFDIEGNEDSLKKNSKQTLVLALIDIRDNFRDKVIEYSREHDKLNTALKRIDALNEQTSQLMKDNEYIANEIRASLLTAMAMKGYSPYDLDIISTRNGGKHAVEEKLDILLAHVGEDYKEPIPDDVLLIKHLLDVLDRHTILPRDTENRSRF